ncbi:SMP-30/gluconolactonase/LRE family protein [Brevundimonas sp. SL161]|uniref:SMP-30/gluconolactonase/LRE family protein n=1 Tax=Brevundimonas sp. SL161 TaxID=2804613 RepID=UPI003CF6155B
MAIGFDRRQFLGTSSAFLAAAPVTAVRQGSSYAVVGEVQRLDPALDVLIDADAVVEKVFDGLTWSEGPCWVGGPDGYLLISDVPGNVIHRWTAADGLSPWLAPSGYEGPADPGLREPGTNGLIQARGGLVAADSGGRRIVHIDLDTRLKTPLCTHFEGRRFNSPNDLVLASDGAIYFTDPPYGLTGVLESPLRELPYTGVFRLDPDNTVTLLDDEVMPNGIGLSPDGRTLYATDRRGWVAWNLHLNSQPGQRRTLIDREETGILGGDGFKVDSVGNLWASSRDGVSIFQDGRRIGIITSDDVISNCELAADGHLYISSNHAVVRVRVRASKLTFQ